MGLTFTCCAERDKKIYPSSTPYPLCDFEIDEESDYFTQPGLFTTPHRLTSDNQQLISAA